MKGPPAAAPASASAAASALPPRLTRADFAHFFANHPFPHRSVEAFTLNALDLAVAKVPEGKGTSKQQEILWATASPAAISQPASGHEAATAAVAAAAAPPDAQPSAEAQQAAASAAPPSANAQHVVELEVDECGKSDGDYMNEFLDDLVELVKDRDTDLGTQAVWEKFPDKARQRILDHKEPGA